MQPFIALSNFECSGLDVIHERASFELKHFEQRKTFEQGVEFVEIVLDAGEPVEETNQFAEDVFRDVAELAIGDAVDDEIDFVLEI